MSTEEVLSKFMDNIEGKFNISRSDLERLIPIISEKKKKKITPCNNDIQCMGRKQDGKQCTRRRKEGSDYCGKHINCQKYGRIDDNNNDKMNDELLRTVLINIDNKEYLIDNNKNLFTFHLESPEYIGKFIDNRIVSCY